MIVETGYSNADEVRAEKVMKELMARMTGVVSGVFYWEPEIYGGWDHTYWDGFWHTSPCVFGKKVVNNGAFTEKRRAVCGTSRAYPHSISGRHVRHDSRYA